MDERVWPSSSAQMDSQTTFAAPVKVDIRVADAYAMQTCYSVYGFRERVLWIACYWTLRL